MSLDHIVVDVEIAHTIEETPGGWDATDRLGIAVAALWQYRDCRMRVYGPDDVATLRKRLLEADRISTFNGWMFDFPVIWGFSKVAWKAMEGEGSKILRPKCDDLLRRIWVALGFNPDGGWQSGMGGAKLDDIAAATLGVRKIGNGADAPKWFQAGQWAKVTNYCVDDVCIERDLTTFVDQFGFVIHNGKPLRIPPWQPGK
jgi:DEAD/DEAH box helicase domain-containing protein